MARTRGPLAGLEIDLHDTGRPYRLAAGLLAGLGASVGGSGHLALGHPSRTGARLIPAGGRLPADGLPAGTIDHATGVALAAAALAAWRAGQAVEVSEVGVAIELWLPEVMAASYAAPPAMRPRPPVAAPGGGWLHLDLGSPGDAEAYDRLLATLPGEPDAATVAAAAQEWRLAVCDYRTAPPAGDPHPISVTTPAGSVRPLSAELTICDLTTMWAGPLTTRLLQDLGARVHKVEPAFRPDGMRAMSGGGIHPGGHQVEPGRDSAMWHALNTGKAHHDLDLRVADQMEEFLELAAGCDVVIDSFSPRVMPNFGVADRLEGDPVVVSMPAFPPGPHRDWVAYGAGVHALMGLGDRGDATFREPAVSYPDPLAGFTGALAVLAAAVGRDRGVAVRRVESTLAGAVEPLAGVGGGAGWGAPAPARSVGARLLERGRSEGLMVSRRVAGRDLLHPVGPFQRA